MAVNKYVTPAGAGLKNGTSWANAFGLAEWIVNIETLAAADDYYWIKQGTYTFAAAPLDGIDCGAVDGTALLPVRVIGVLSGTTNEPPVASDWAYNDNRPLIAAGAFIFAFNNYWRIFNLRHTTDHADGLRADAASIVWNCKVTATSTRGIYSVGQGTNVINCEVSNSGGQGIVGASTYLRVIGCYLHDCMNDAVAYNNNGGVLLFNLIDTCPTGFDIFAKDYAVVFGNTFYNCTLAIDGTDAGDPERHVYMNNIFDTCTVGANWGADEEVGCNFWDYNNWNAAPVTNVTRGPNALALDPQFVDAANGDFRVGMNLRRAGFPGEFPGGLCDGYLDVGAVQRRSAVIGKRGGKL